jgi:hypothetical protein
VTLTTLPWLVTQHQHLVVLIANTKIDVATAIEINKLFCEVVIAPDTMRNN